MTGVQKKIHRTFPKSVQPGIPKIVPTPQGARRCLIGDLFDVVRRPLKLENSKEYDLVTVKRARGGVERRATIKGAKIAVKSQFELSQDDFLISKRQIVHGACGIVSEQFSGSIVSNEYSVLRCRPGLDLEYLGHLSHSVYFQQTCFHSSVGVHIEKMIFKLDEWFKWPINLPSLPEQKKIAAFLGVVDDKVSALQDRQAGLERYKRGLMQALFSQRLRFTKPDGTPFPDWEEKRLGNVADVNPKSEELPLKFNYVDLESVTNGVMAEVQEIDKAIAPSRAQRLLSQGDILFQTVRPYQKNNLYFDQKGIFVASTGYAQIRAKQNRQYLFQVLHTDLFANKVVKRCTGTSYPAINSNELARIQMPFPHPEEQQKIADALSAMDAKIQAVADQVTQMQSFKKGLLQQMFV